MKGRSHPKGCVSPGPPGLLGLPLWLEGPRESKEGEAGCGDDDALLTPGGKTQWSEARKQGP